MKKLLIILFILISGWLLLSTGSSWQVLVSFSISVFLLLTILYLHLFLEKTYSPFITVFIVFSFLFFIVAPLIQIKVIDSRNADFMTNFPYDSGDIVFTNFLVIIFNTVFFLSYWFLKGRRRISKITLNSNNYYKRLPLTIMILLVFSFLIAIVSFGFVKNEMIKASGMSLDVSTGLFLLWKKVLFLVPFAGIILCVEYYKKNKKTSLNLLYLVMVLVLFISLLIWFKNPLVEKRNALGPIYITLIYLFIPKLLNSNVKTTFFMFFSMIVVFPLSAVITHTTSTLGDIIKKPRILLDQFEGEGINEVFDTLHYDAFINISATVDYVKYEGFSYGEQLLSAFLFFIPRNLWEDKPINTGHLVGQHLIENYDFHYGNLSNAMVSEGYINFGIPGVILMAIALAYTIVYLLSWLEGTHYLKKMMAFYFAIHLLFFLRGDFTNGFSYYVGTSIGVLGIFKMVDFLIKNALLNQKLWKQKQKNIV